MALLEFKGFGVSHGAARVAGIDLTVEPARMLAIVGRDGAVPLLALAVSGLLPKGATIEGTMSLAVKRVLYLDRHADASALATPAELIVADEPGRERDPATQLALLTALQEASRTAAVMIFTADFRLALNMGLEVAVVAGGKLLLKAPASQIFELPQYDTVRHLVGGQRLRTRTLMRPPIGEPVLEVDGVARSFRRGLPRLGPSPVEALKGIGFSVRQGEVVGILGLGGAGKSTLLRLVAGLDRPSVGRIGRRPGLIGYVFPDPRKAFNPTLPVGVSLTEPLRVEQTLLVEEQADRLVEVVRAVGLEPDLLARLPGEFGVAALQRMALARALVGRPNLLLLDDPTACLDPADAREFLVLFSRVRADFGLTAIVASREFEVMRAVTDRVLVLEAGHIVEGGKPGELLEAPKHELTQRLVATRYPGPIRHSEPNPPPVAPEPPLPVPEPVVETPVEPAPLVREAAAVVEPVPPEPDPVHTLSAAIVIAPVVLPDPPPAAPEPQAAAPPEPEPLIEEPEATQEPVPQDVVVAPAPALPEQVVVPKPATDAADPEAVPEPVPVASDSEPDAVPMLFEPIPEPAAAEPVPAPDSLAPPEAVPEPAGPITTPEPEPAPPEPQPASEPVQPLSGDGADEAAEGGKGEVAADGRVDTARSVDAPDGEAGR